jgi:thiamine biosynthesis lipoprotein
MSTTTDQPGGDLRVIHEIQYVMGTVITFDVYVASGASGSDVSARLARARAAMRSADALFSIWRPDSPINRLRRGEITSDQAPPELTQLLERCAWAKELSGGWFDPWAMPGGVDPTGYVKGWAAQRALGMLVSSDICGAIVNAAGDIATFGGPAPGQPFRVGIADPFSPRHLAHIVELGGSIATSGTYERGQHLIDPHSGEPMALVASASVCGPDLGLADALATAIAVAGERALSLVETIDGYEALTIALDGTARWTPNFPFAPTRAVSAVGPAPGEPAGPDVPSSVLSSSG